MVLKKEHKFILLSLFSLLIFTVIFYQVWTNGYMVNFDKLLNEGIVPQKGFLLQLSTLFHYLFGTIGFILILLVLIGIFLVKKKRTHSLFVLIILFGTLGLTYIMKNIMHRVRPVNIIETGYSFPSGHTIYSFILISLFFYLFISEIKNIYLKRIWATLGVLIIILVAFSRIYLQVHWFSDILGSWALGLTIFGLAVYLHEKFKHLDKKEKWI